MSISTVSRPARIVKHRRKFSYSVSSAPDAIPALWRESVALESIAPIGLRGGLVRARTALLDGVPAWQLPTILDSMTTEGVKA